MRPERFYGGARFIDMAGSYYMRLYGPKFNSFSLDTLGSAQEVWLPNVIAAPKGVTFYIANVSVFTTATLRVLDFEGYKLDPEVTLGPGMVARLSCYSVDTRAGRWVSRIYNVGVARSSTAIRPTMPDAQPAVCYPANAILVSCNQPEVALYIRDPGIMSVMGKVIRIGSGCWRVYQVRDATVHGVPLPAYDMVSMSCLDCGRSLGFNPSVIGDADDQHIDPRDYIPAVGSYAP